MNYQKNDFINWVPFFHLFLKKTAKWLRTKVYFARSIRSVPNNSIIFFPCHYSLFSCGLAGIVTFAKKTQSQDLWDVSQLEKKAKEAQTFPFSSLLETGKSGREDNETFFIQLLESVRQLKQDSCFYRIFKDTALQSRLSTLAETFHQFGAMQEKWLVEHMGTIPSETVDFADRCLERIKDISWSLSSELLGNIRKTMQLIPDNGYEYPSHSIIILKKINAVLSSIDRLEVRGRDSAGLSVFLSFDEKSYSDFQKELERKNLTGLFTARIGKEVLSNQGIDIRRSENTDGSRIVTLALTYKVAAEIGDLGDNIRFLRNQIKSDPLFWILISKPPTSFTVLCHTRWASCGEITEANCHPVDNRILEDDAKRKGIIHVCLNGDIDNYLELKKNLEKNHIQIPQDITTDTKIIPLQIEYYLRQGCDLEDAFCKAVSDFEGSHAIIMHTDLAPGKMFLAKRGSGQALFIGMAPDHYMASSEVYGFVEETPVYLKLDGKKPREGINGGNDGYVIVLDPNRNGGVDGIRAKTYDGQPIPLSERDLKTTRISSRDIDRHEFPHYFLKEVSESPVSVEKTLQNHWKIKSNGHRFLTVSLDEKTFPSSIKKALQEDRIKRVFFVGQGTAGVAAFACAEILSFYMNDPALPISALKASELSGFKLEDDDHENSMSDSLVIAITQSGTTADTNRTIDMVRERGAHTIAIVNRRDSDITFKVDGVFYTSSGRDIEMSVASTKAFYSQIVAGALLSLHMAALKKRRSDVFVSKEIKDLLELPGHMRKILSMRDRIEASARKLAVTRTYWAAVGSGPNKVAADEIRIKLSELCYKTISSDYVEDKKHIDLSSEPLIIVCAAGSKGTVIGDIVKDTAIFHAHKATPVVIADEGEYRFNPYAADVFHVPTVSQHLAPILNTLVGHIWGYYAALAINEGSRFLYGFRESIQNTIEEHLGKGLDIYEIVLEKSFREKIALFYSEFRRKKAGKQLPTDIGFDTAADLPLLLKYLAGRLPTTDFELDFGLKGTASNMLTALFNHLGESINQMARPVDAIKHQAKTVTVGTSRMREKIDGVLFEALFAKNFNISNLTNKNIIVLKNLQGIIRQIKGGTLYHVEGLNVLGEPTEETTISVIGKEGSSAGIPSRIETDHQLKGTKRIIVREGNVYIGKGRKDGRSILIIPVISVSGASLNMIRYLYLLEIVFKEGVPLSDKIKALGGKYERIKNIVQENSTPWEDPYLDRLAMDELFGNSAEKIGEKIVNMLGSRSD